MDCKVVLQVKYVRDAQGNNYLSFRMLDNFQFCQMEKHPFFYHVVHLA